MKRTQGGFIPILVAIIVVAALAIGGGYYASKKKAHVPDMSATSTASTTVVADNNATSTAGVGSANSTLRALLASGKDTTCTFTGEGDKGGAVSGTVFISGTSMRGDFSVVTGSTTMASHMIKQGDTVYLWSGAQGAKMSFSATSSAEAQTKNGVMDLDKKVDYSCSAWTPDSSKFTVPTGTTFMDVNAAMKAAGSAIKTNLKGNVNVGGSVKY